MAVSPHDKKEFIISRKDAERIVDGLELAASWDKTKIYYILREWIDEDKKIWVNAEE